MFAKAVMLMIIGFLVGVTTLIETGVRVYDHVHWALQGREATMTLADTSRNATIPASTFKFEHFPLDVRYSGPDGEVLVQRQFDAENARALLSGKRFKIRYLKDEPSTILFEYDELDSWWLPLVGAIAGLGFGAFMVWFLRGKGHLGGTPTDGDSMETDTDAADADGGFS